MLFLTRIGVGYELNITRHHSFIENRVAEIFVKGRSIGIIGEIYPKVLENWNLDTIVAFEVEIESSFL